MQLWQIRWAVGLGAGLLTLTALPSGMVAAQSATAPPCTTKAVAAALGSADKVLAKTCAGGYAGGVFKGDSGKFGFVLKSVDAAGGPNWLELDPKKACRSGKLPGKVYRAGCATAVCSDRSIAIALRGDKVRSRTCREGFAGGSASNSTADYSYLVKKSSKNGILVWKDVKDQYCAKDMIDQVPDAVRKVSCDVS